MEESSFSNEQVHLNDIPAIELLEYSKLEDNKLKVDIINTIVFFAILAGVLGALIIGEVDYVKDYSLYVFVLIGILLLLSLFFTYFGFKKRGYAVRERDITYKEGLIWRSTTVLPYNRVQHCEVNQGPIDRCFNLAEIKIFTAGGSSSDLTISGLTRDKADRIKDFILKKASDEEE